MRRPEAREKCGFAGVLAHKVRCTRPEINPIRITHGKESPQTDGMRPARGFRRCEITEL